MAVSNVPFSVASSFNDVQHVIRTRAGQVMYHIISIVPISGLPLTLTTFGVQTLGYSRYIFLHFLFTSLNYRAPEGTWWGGGTFTDYTGKYIVYTESVVTEVYELRHSIYTCAVCEF